MPALSVSTEILVPPDTAFSFLVDFPGYATYSPYLDDVRQRGDGGPGTEYDLAVSWWRISYTARTIVTAIEPPERIAWELVEDLEAHGCWYVEPTPDEREASRVSFYVNYDPASRGDVPVDLPRFVSIDWVIQKVKPLVRREAEATVRRVVEDLEGQARPVDIEIDTDADRPDQ